MPAGEGRPFQDLQCCIAIACMVPTCVRYSSNLLTTLRFVVSMMIVMCIYCSKNDSLRFDLSADHDDKLAATSGRNLLATTYYYSYHNYHDPAAAAAAAAAAGGNGAAAAAAASSGTLCFLSLLDHLSVNQMQTVHSNTALWPFECTAVLLPVRPACTQPP